MAARDRVRDAARAARKATARLSADARRSYARGVFQVLVSQHPEVEPYRETFYETLEGK